ncbi:MAG: hypothetical protein ABSB18_08090 [Candidatus Omnitrophota bacterium]
MSSKIPHKKESVFFLAVLAYLMGIAEVAKLIFYNLLPFFKGFFLHRIRA